jgi:hypothetical protein
VRRTPILLLSLSLFFSHPRVPSSFSRPTHRPADEKSQVETARFLAEMCRSDKIELSDGVYSLKT